MTIKPEFRRLLRTNVVAFAQKAHLTLTGAKLVRHRYVRLLCDDVERLRHGELTRHVVNLPPGQGKTFIMSVCLAAWTLAHDPTVRILVVCYNADLAREISFNIRTIVDSEWFKAVFETRIDRDRRSVTDFATTAGGRSYATSIEGGITGRRADLIIIDDPVRIADANDVKQHAFVEQRFGAEIQTRLRDPQTGVIVVVQHRLHPQDLAGQLIARGWSSRVLPMVAEHEERYEFRDGTTWTRPVGDILRPDAFTPESIEELRKDVRSPGFGPLYQQRFDGDGYLKVQREDVKVVRYYANPELPYVMSVDPARKAEGASFSVVQLWACAPDGSSVLVRQERGHFAYEELRKAARRMARKYSPTVALVEESGFGFGLAADLAPLVRVQTITPLDNKAERLRQVLPAFRSGKVKLPIGAEFADEFIEELVAFPAASHTDQLDATTQFLSWRAANPQVQRVVRRNRAVGAVSNARVAAARIAVRRELGLPPQQYVVSRKR